MHENLATMNRLLLPALLCAIGLPLCSEAQNLILNGDFETANPGPEPVQTFPNWTEYTTDSSSVVKNSAAVAETGVLISGSISGELVAGATNGGAIRQMIAGAPAKFTLELQFASLTPAGGAAATDRFFSLQLKHGLETSTDQINLRVVTNGQLQAFSQSAGAFQNIGTLTANFTTDSGTAGLFDSETAVVNTLRIDGDYDTTDGTATPFYSITLNGGTVSGLAFFQGSVSAANNGLDALAFNGTLSAKNFLVDNVSLVAIPEPASAATLLAGCGMLLGVQRFRRRECRFGGRAISP